MRRGNPVTVLITLIGYSGYPAGVYALYLAIVPVTEANRVALTALGLGLIAVSLLATNPGNLRGRLPIFNSPNVLVRAFGFVAPFVAIFFLCDQVFGPRITPAAWLALTGFWYAVAVGALRFSR